MDALCLSPAQWREGRRVLLEQLADSPVPAGTLPEAWSESETLQESVFNLDSYNQLVGEICQQTSVDQAAKYGFLSLPAEALISVVVPVFNEDATIERVLRRLASCPVVGQIIVVNDASSDGTACVLQSVDQEKTSDFWVERLPGGLHLISHPVNRGKGAALQTGFALTTLNWVAIQDADTEYDPLDLIRLMNETRESSDRGPAANVVYGSRYLSRSNVSSPLWHRAGNGLITWAANRFNGLQLTDVETCYKLIRRDLLEAVRNTLKENRFGIEIELTAKLARHPATVFAECPIQYEKRSYAEGKKIGVKDGVRALWCMLRYRVRD